MMHSQPYFAMHSVESGGACLHFLQWVMEIFITPLGRVMAICIAYLGVGAVAIPTGIISAGFVEQYQRKSNISGLKNEDIKEIAEVFVDKKYAGKTVQDMEEANQLTVFLILREDFSILPQKDTILRMNDIIVIRDENENS